MRSRTLHTRVICAAVLVWAVATSCAATSVRAASFPCTAARTLREKTICAVPQLSAIDTKLSTAYKAELQNLSPASAAWVHHDQREWLLYLDKVCPRGVRSSPTLADCLLEHYTVRLEQLKQQPQRHSGMRFFVRSHVVFARGPAAAKGETRASMDPGFGYGEFAWLQIDSPTPAQRAWNEAAYHAAITEEAGTSGTVAASFEAAVDGTGFLYGFPALIAANDTLVDTTFKTESYGWGAAHPLTGQSSFLWWLDRGRTVAVHDVFEPSSSWQARLTVPTLAALRKEPGSTALFQGDELEKGIAEGVQQIANWGLTAEGLTITFGQYQVAPYVTGMPSVTLPWQELKPLLNADLPVKALPARLSEDP